MGMPMIQVFNSEQSQVMLFNMNDAKLSKSLGTLRLAYNEGYDPQEIQKLFIEGKIHVKIGKQALKPAVIRDNESPFPEIVEDGDYIIWTSDLKAGKNMLQLSGMGLEENAEGNRNAVHKDYYVVGSKQVTFTIARS